MRFWVFTAMDPCNSPQYRPYRTMLGDYNVQGGMVKQKVEHFHSHFSKYLDYGQMALQRTAKEGLRRRHLEAKILITSTHSNLLTRISDIHYGSLKAP